MAVVDQQCRAGLPGKFLSAGLHLHEWKVLSVLFVFNVRLLRALLSVWLPVRHSIRILPAMYGLTLGMVVSSSVSSDINAIDPALFMDSNGKVYLSYGSFSGGIGVVEIDPATGKKKSGASVVKVAGGSGADWEAPYIVKEGSYYYLFANRGLCCKGSSSTYYIVVGRSSSPTGPYVDKSNVNMNSGGGSVMLGSSGRYIGPGHFGLLRQGGSNFVSMHYYDGNDNGNPKLDIVNMGFSSGWPFLTRDWIASGTYRITNQNSGKVWDAWGCTGAAGQAIAQGTWSNVACQKWNFTPVGDGNYRITCNRESNT